jgi:hypothetical protein
MRGFRLLRLLALYGTLVAAPLCPAQDKSSTDTGECGGEPSAAVTNSKTAVRTDRENGVRVYGVVQFRRNTEDAVAHRCHVKYELYVARKGAGFAQVRQLSWDTGDGEIAGIDLVGFSPDGSKLAADFWLAAGDGEEHRPVVYDSNTYKVRFRSLGDRIQRKINSCDQIERFVGVTNQGDAIFTVPPSDYDDSQECGDKGVWKFDLLTGEVRRIKQFSGDRWK